MNITSEKERKNLSKGFPLSVRVKKYKCIFTYKI